MTRDSWLRTAHEFLQLILSDESEKLGTLCCVKAGIMCKKNRSDCRAEESKYSKNPRLGTCTFPS